MHHNLHGLTSMKAWLLKHHVYDWGEGIAEGIFFSLIAWGVWKSTGG